MTKPALQLFTICQPETILLLSCDLQLFLRVWNYQNTAEASAKWQNSLMWVVHERLISGQILFFLFFIFVANCNLNIFVPPKLPKQARVLRILHFINCSYTSFTNYRMIPSCLGCLEHVKKVEFIIGHNKRIHLVNSWSPFLAISSKVKICKMLMRLYGWFKFSCSAVNYDFGSVLSMSLSFFFLVEDLFSLLS